MGDRIMPYFWVSGGDQADFEAAFREDDSVRDATPVDGVDHSVLHRAEWTENVEAIIYAYTDASTSRNSRWRRSSTD